MDSKKRKLPEPPPHVKPTKLFRKEPPTGPTKTKFIDSSANGPHNFRAKFVSRKRQDTATRPGATHGKAPDGREGNEYSNRRVGGTFGGGNGGGNWFGDGLGNQFNGGVIDGSIWHEQCKVLVKNLPRELPLSFASVEDYVSTFEPFLQEEARESLKSSWVDACEAGNIWAVRVKGVDTRGGGGARVEVELIVNMAGKQDAPNSNNTVVLTSFCPASKNPLEHSQKISRGNYDQRDIARGSFPKVPQGNFHPLKDVKSDFQEKGVVGIVGGVVGPVDRDKPNRLFIELRPECQTHKGTQDSPCNKVIEQLKNATGAWCLTGTGTLVTQTREWDALHSIRKIPFINALLKPDVELNVEIDKVPRKWPAEVGPGFHEHMKTTYDGPQSDAIAMCTAHFSSPSQTNPPNASGSKVNKEKALPVVLIQGPPGTGKTHTVRGVLNAWHLVQFQRYYDKVIGQFRGVPRTGNGAWDSLMELMKSGEMRTSMKPRILVCAPSNAATDELLERILKEGFSDASGRKYYPNVVRVGSEVAPVSEGVRAVWVDDLVTQWMSMGKKEWKQRMQACIDRRNGLGNEISGTERLMRDDRSRVDELAGALISNMERKEKNELEMYRLEVVETVLGGAHPSAMRDARERLELSYLDHAEMVFTTLSSTGKKVFSKVRRGFETVLVDEAAQACEIAVMQPLVYGCQHCVLVGDPQQLPATVLSQKAKELNMERSLFERLQKAGAPVKVLSVQYRMHPHIRQFPSSYFYNNLLQDGEIVKQDQRQEFYNHGLLKPYVVFDVATGQHARQGSGSLQNQVEANMAVALFQELRDYLIKRFIELTKARKPPPPSVQVGVITPYRSQRRCLQETFVKVLGKKIADEVKIMTVDSFQGKQCDVIILSCVRASSKSSGVGFVADIRRMNVAITRARKALWILGNCQTLSANQAWGELIKDAEKRGCLIKDASAKELFPHLPQFQAKEDSPAESGEVENGRSDDRLGGRFNGRGGRGRGRGQGRGAGRQARKSEKVEKQDQGKKSEMGGSVVTVDGSKDAGGQSGHGGDAMSGVQYPTDPRKGVIQSSADEQAVQKTVVVNAVGESEERKAPGLAGSGTIIPPTSTANAVLMPGVTVPVSCTGQGTVEQPHVSVVHPTDVRMDDANVLGMSQQEFAALHQAVRQVRTMDLGVVENPVARMLPQSVVQMQPAVSNPPPGLQYGMPPQLHPAPPPMLTEPATGGHVGPHQMMDLAPSHPSAMYHQLPANAQQGVVFVSPQGSGVPLNAAPEHGKQTVILPSGQVAQVVVPGGNPSINVRPSGPQGPFNQGK